MGNPSPLRLGSSAGSSPLLVLAPLEGITTAVFRRVAMEMFGGLDGAIAPFIGTIRGARRYDYHLRDVLPGVNGSLPLIPQILGADPEGIVHVSRACADLGYTQVNWNIGCPIPNITRKKRGSGILPHPHLIEEVLSRSCRPDLPAFSVKLRLGLEEADEWREVLKVLNDFPLDFVVLHPRTGRQMYRGTPDREAYGEFLARCRPPLFYSGDIKSAEDFQGSSVRFPETAGWLLGRGFLSRPVLAREIRSGRKESFAMKEIAHFLRRLADEFLASGAAPQWVLGKMKLYFGYLKHGSDDAAQAGEFWTVLRGCREWGLFEDRLREFL
ncbi:tRNA-dihydrouridine synthase family protein [Marispirochaeta aestuarii]|uniref:tRNA-dihydrouridine synthase family protein n=1 Tax=Marispirochaeta aestuarii TaxID=1963862 RepID=UPI0029C8FA2F|nr:tRNA-dihydrouridine synthase family protein [Marispirochaeta aestuarii]